MRRIMLGNLIFKAFCFLFFLFFTASSTAATRNTWGPVDRVFVDYYFCQKDFQEHWKTSAESLNCALAIIKQDHKSAKVKRGQIILLDHLFVGPQSWDSGEKAWIDVNSVTSFFNSIKDNTLNSLKKGFVNDIEVLDHYTPFTSAKLFNPITQKEEMYLHQGYYNDAAVDKIKNENVLLYSNIPGVLYLNKASIRNIDKTLSTYDISNQYDIFAKGLGKKIELVGIAPHQVNFSIGSHVFALHKDKNENTNIATLARGAASAIELAQTVGVIIGIVAKGTNLIFNANSKYTTLNTSAPKGMYEQTTYSIDEANLANIINIEDSDELPEPYRIKPSKDDYQRLQDALNGKDFEFLIQEHRRCEKNGKGTFGADVCAYIKILFFGSIKKTNLEWSLPENIISEIERAIKHKDKMIARDRKNLMDKIFVDILFRMQTEFGINMLWDMFESDTFENLFIKLEDLIDTCKNTPSLLYCDNLKALMLKIKQGLDDEAEIQRMLDETEFEEGIFDGSLEYSEIKSLQMYHAACLLGLNMVGCQAVIKYFQNLQDKLNLLPSPQLHRSQYPSNAYFDILFKHAFNYWEVLDVLSLFSKIKRPEQAQAMKEALQNLLQIFNYFYSFQENPYAFYWPTKIADIEFLIKNIDDLALANAAVHEALKDIDWSDIKDIDEHFESLSYNAQNKETGTYVLEDIVYYYNYEKHIQAYLKHKGYTQALKQFNDITKYYKKILDGSGAILTLQVVCDLEFKNHPIITYYFLRYVERLIKNPKIKHDIQKIIEQLKGDFGLIIEDD